MSILWCGGEDVDVAYKGSGWYDYEAGALSGRSGYARGRIVVANAAFGYRTNPVASPFTSAWLSMYALMDLRGQYTNRPAFGFGKSSTQGGIFWGLGTNSNRYAFFKAASDGTLTKIAEAASGDYVDGQVYKYDLYIADFNTVSATITLYVNTVQMFTWTGDLTGISGMTNFDCISAWGGGAAGQRHTELILADEDTRMMSLVTIYPNGAGDANTMTGDYTMVDEFVVSDADLISSDANGEVCQLALSNLPSGNFSVKAVKLAVRGMKGVSGPTTLKLGVKSGGTVSVDAGRTMDSVMATVERLMAVNPVGGAAFTQSQVDALQFAMESAA